MNPATFPADYARLLTHAGDPRGNAPEVPAEPPLKAYVFAARR